MLSRYTYFLFLFLAVLCSNTLIAQSKTEVQENIKKLHQTIKDEAYKNPEQSLLLAEEALLLSQKNGLEKEEQQSYYSFGLIYYYKSYYVLSNDYYRSITLSPKSDQKQRSAAWNNMGVNFEMLGKIDSALYAYQESRKIDCAIGDVKGENMTLINIGLLNGSLKRYDLAFAQTRKAKKYFEETNDFSNLGLCYMNLGLFYDENGQVDSSKINFERAAAIYTQTKDYPNLIQTYLNLTSFWVFQKNKAKAKESLQKAKELISFVESPYQNATVHGFTSLLYDNFGENDSAIYYSKKALSDFESMGVLENIKEEYYNLAGLYAETGKVKEYHVAIQQYDSLSKALLNEDINKRLAEMEVRYKLDIKNKEVEKATKSLSERTTQIIIISAFTLFLLIALAITYSLYSKVKIAHQSLYEKNVELMENEAKQGRSDILPDIVEENQLLTRFQQLMLEQELYKRQDLTLKNAALELGTNEKYLSQAINAGGLDNFNTYVNRFRVNEARRIILEGQNNQISIEELGSLVGFTNRHTFSRAFTQIAGINPSEFRKIYLTTQG